MALGVVGPARGIGSESNGRENGAEDGSIGTVSYHTEPQFPPLK